MNYGAIPGGSIYAATKAALQAITTNLAVELGPKGIRVNAISPGLIPTHMTAGIPETVRSKVSDEFTPLHRLGSVDDVAHAALYLASPISSFITGNDIVVDGGSRLYHSATFAFNEMINKKAE